MGVAPARLGANEFNAPYEANRTIETTIGPTAYHQPHWCLAGDDGLSANPPDIVIEGLARAESARSHDAQAIATVTPVGGTGGMPIHRVVSRMFGGY